MTARCDVVVRGVRTTGRRDLDGGVSVDGVVFSFIEW